MKTLILLAALMLGQFAQAELVNVKLLNQKNQKTGKSWFAKPNHLTDLSLAEARRYMGLRLQGAIETQFVVPAEMSTMSSNLPSKLDWRNKDGQNWVSPIKDQANCGSCVAFASVGVLETQYRISSLFPNFNIKLSPQHLFSCGGGSCATGWMPENAARFIQRYGVPDEACMPYQSGSTGQDVACNTSCSDSKQRVLTISGFTTPTRGYQNIDAVKAALQNGPVVTSMKVYSDFVAYAGGIYQHTMGEILGGHAISIIGYDDEKQAFIIRNSWGESWGENGFAYVAYDDDSGVGDDTWLYSLPKLTGGVSVLSPDDHSYFTKVVPVKASSSYAATDTLSVSIFNSENKAVVSISCASATCAQELDISSLSDGKYEIQIYAMNNRGEQLGSSERHFFYVANQKPQMSMSFQGAGSVNLKTPLKGRVQFEINANSDTVPMSSVDFHRRGPNGKEEVRSAFVVPSKLVMGWRTNLVENGQYEVWFVGHLKSNGMDISVESEHQTVTVRN
ncbi:MAG: C1 family peptidase [Pseudobdellovibrionaceae bacterium]